MKIFYYTFGCKVNQYETENIRESFENKGFETTKEINDADIYIINTCTVTSVSDKKNRQMIHRIKKENPSAVLVLTGCFPQAFENQAEKITEADIITGSSNKSMIPQYVEEYLISHNRIIAVNEHTRDEKFEEMKNEKFTDKTRAYIKIQDGCDQYCTYCIIPYARGHIRSKPINQLKAEAEALQKAGHCEIVLVGINLSCYGREFGLRLVDAVEAVCSVEGIERVRLGSLEPELISDEDIDRMSRQKNLCPQFHLSIQSGCDNTLKAMNRKYNTSEYSQIVEKLRKSFKDCAITTDIMVGFPGETDEDFNESLQYAEKIKFSKSHIFPYSIREGTIAAKRSDQIDSRIKEERAKKMAAVCEKAHRDFLSEFIGKTVPVLVETKSDDGYYKGYTPNYTLVKIMSQNMEKGLKNKIIYVKIERLEKDYCLGTIIE